MVRIGLTRWFVDVRKESMPRGEIRFVLALQPQASRYRVLEHRWAGIHDEWVEREVEAKGIEIARVGLAYDLACNPVRQMELLCNAASDLATQAVEYALRHGLVSFASFDKSASVYVVRTIVLRAVERGQSDVPELVERIDLVAEMRAIREERERQALELERLQREAYMVHLEEAARRATSRSESAATSFDLLYSFLSERETKEAREKGHVTVETAAGVFVVPVLVHGMVERYVNGQCEGNYCVVFRDWMIPLGDEVLMKIALLKADPHKFLRVANRFHPQHVWRRRPA